MQSQSLTLNSQTDGSLDELAVIVEGAKKHYQMGTEVVKALDGIDLQIKKGEYVSITGPSGSGKTTLFNVVGGLTQPPVALGSSGWAQHFKTAELVNCTPRSLVLAYLLAYPVGMAANLLFVSIF